ncbi:hypothetical protein BGZ76_000716 [Entomortierella beljakovae]|nr:hypothetical protein BGZ76_000716 [Entomortierella beljakovae]
MLPLFKLLVIGAALQIAVHSAPLKTNNVCQTKACKQISNILLGDMNLSVDPCEDFNEFTCGGYIQRAKVSEIKGIKSTLNDMGDEVNALIRSIVTPGDPRNPKIASGDVVTKRIYQKAKDYYGSCVDEKQLSKVGATSILSYLQNIAEIYPVKKSDIFKHNNSSSKRALLPQSDRKAISTYIGQSIKAGRGAFILMSVGLYRLDPTRNILRIEPDELVFSSIEYDEKLLPHYQDTVQKLFELIFDDKNSMAIPEHFQKAAKDAVQFEYALNTIIQEAYNVEEPSNRDTLHTIEELSALSPSIDWDEIFKIALPSGVQRPKDFLAAPIDYFIKLSELIASAPPNVIQNYIVWKTIIQNYQSLATKYRQPISDLFALHNGNPAKDRVTTCIRSFLNADLPHLVGYFFLKAAYNDDTGSKVHEMADSIIHTFNTAIESYDWLDSYTKNGAFEKINAIRQVIGHSLSNPDDGSLQSVDEYHSNITIKPDDMFGNVITAKEFVSHNMFKKLSVPHDPEQLEDAPQTVNAFYHPIRNDIEILAGIIQRPMFNLGYPEYLNYGSIGSVIGHEITHGFDDSGRNFDATGLYRDWWSNSSTIEFNERSQCFIDQYGNFTYRAPDGKDHALDSTLQLGENIADNGGIKKSFETWYARYQSDKSGLKYNNKIVPGFEKFTPEQLYFIQFGHVWCSKSTLDYNARVALSDPHAPPKWRIIGTVQNSEYFAKAFNCKVGTKMNPINKCNLW